MAPLAPARAKESGGDLQAQDPAGGLAPSGRGWGRRAASWDYWFNEETGESQRVAEGADAALAVLAGWRGGELQHRKADQDSDAKEVLTASSVNPQGARASAKPATASAPITLRNFPAPWVSGGAEGPLRDKVRLLLSKFGSLIGEPVITNLEPVVAVRAVFEKASDAHTAVSALHGVDVRTDAEKLQRQPGRTFDVVLEAPAPILSQPPIPVGGLGGASASALPDRKRSRRAAKDRSLSPI